MFSNIGKKIKFLAAILCWIQIIFSVIGGIVSMVAIGKALGGLVGFLLGIVIIAVGVLAAWIGSFMLYGYGQLIDNTDSLVAQTRLSAPRQPAQQPQPQYQQQTYQAPNGGQYQNF